MNLSSFIARRYLFAKKSHNVINIISLISAIGIAVGSCALVIILSVYNGFEQVVGEMYDRESPDFVISSANALYFDASDPLFDPIKEDKRVASFHQVISETVFAIYGNKEGAITVKGVDTLYNPSYKLYHGDIPHAVVGGNIAYRFKVNTRLVEPLTLFFPKRNKDISLSNPLSSLNSASFYPNTILSFSDAVSRDLVIVPIDKGRELLDLQENSASYVEIRLKNENNSASFEKFLQKSLPEGFEIKNRFKQNETVFKMMRIEKGVIFIILLFIMAVVCCNIFGSLTMLIIEKRDDIATLSYLGAPERTIRNIFMKEGAMIIIYGTIIGIAIGILLCMIQKYIGIIKMPDSFALQYYPVIIKWNEILFSFAAITFIGWIIIRISQLPFRRLSGMPRQGDQ